MTVQGKNGALREMPGEDCDRGEGRCRGEWLGREERSAGAGNEIRTRDFNLGKVALYH